MSQVDLKALNEKFPTCSTCEHMIRRETQLRKKKKGQVYWCTLHNRPVEYHWYTDEKGKKHTHGDIPCDDYAYLTKS